MRVGIVGGVDRSEPRYTELARAEGHVLEWHTGDVAGRGADALRALVDRVDFVVVVTDVNSHAGVLGARRRAREREKPCALVRRLGMARFRALLDELPARAPGRAPQAPSRAARFEETLASLFTQPACARTR